MSRELQYSAGSDLEWQPGSALLWSVDVDLAARAGVASAARAAPLYSIPLFARATVRSAANGWASFVAGMAGLARAASWGWSAPALQFDPTAIVFVQKRETAIVIGDRQTGVIKG